MRGSLRIRDPGDHGLVGETFEDGLDVVSTNTAERMRDFGTARDIGIHVCS
jgi:hypothetical protein